MKEQNTISPSLLSPYLRLMRLHQPVGIWLLLWPCWWSLALAHEKNIIIYALFASGALVMRSAGCVINDIFDRKIDAQIERTKTRPLASGELTIRQAMFLLFALIIIAFPIAFALGKNALIWSMLALPLIAIYPLMKRITYWPQLFLGITFNWGVLVAAAASSSGEITAEFVMLYLACCSWTLGYDTIYAVQDKESDEKLGVKSSAIATGKYIRVFVGLCYASFLILFFIAINNWQSNSPKSSYLSIVLFILMLEQLIWQIRKINLINTSSCRAAFLSNSWFGLLAFVTIICSTY